nr:bifunctional hydroxymethylpyrimidine kinase/phosphomethylpyrimidine kinase [Tissierella sp.]
MKKVLTIAGSDCSGGAGIQADLKTFAALGVYGMSVITSVTAQNTKGVTDVVDLSPEFVGAQMDAVFGDIFPDAVKIGMVSNAEIIKMIAKKLKEYGAKNIVLDPVMVSTSGSNLMDSKATRTLIEELLPLADIITPNMSEAAVLSEIEVNNKEDMEKAAVLIAESIDGIVLVKGGHLESSADDLLFIDGKFDWVEGARIDNENTHGTGCTLSSAIATNLAKEMDVREAFIQAKEYLRGAIEDGLDLGEGRGPLNHIYNIN